jgi:hypothetical protein
MSMTGELHRGGTDSCARNGDAAATAPSDAKTLRLSMEWNSLIPRKG